MNGIYENNQDQNNQGQNNQNINQSNYGFNYDVRQDMRNYTRFRNNQGNNMYIYFLMANIALILSIMSFCCSFITAIPAVILSIISIIKIGPNSKSVSAIILSCVLGLFYLILIIALIVNGDINININ